MSGAIFLPTQRNRQPARPTLQTEAPIAPRQGDLESRVTLPTIWNHLHIEDSCGFQWRDVDTVTPEFPLDLHNTSPSPEYFRHQLHYFIIIIIIIINYYHRLFVCPSFGPLSVIDSEVFGRFSAKAA